MDEDYIVLQGAGSFTVTAKIFGCMKCGIVVWDQKKHTDQEHSEVESSGS